MLQPLTAEAQQVSASSHLGRPTAAYRAKFTIKKAIAVAFLFAVGLGMLAVVILDSSSVPPSTVIAVVIASVLFLALPLWIVVDAVRSRDIQVYVCPGGLLYLHGGKTEAIRWDQVDACWRKVVKTSSYGIQTGTTHRYSLRRADGATFKFNDNIGNVEALGNTIAAETARTLWPRYIAAYQAGQTLLFGKISLNQQGVNNGKEWLPWYQLSPIQIQRGFLSLQKEGDRQGNRRVIPAADIPNLDVFLALVNDIQSWKRR